VRIEAPESASSRRTRHGLVIRIRVRPGEPPRPAPGPQHLPARRGRHRMHRTVRECPAMSGGSVRCHQAATLS